MDIFARTLRLLDTGAGINATCSSFYESVIESCVWEDSGAFYFGDWQITDAGDFKDVWGIATITVIGGRGRARQRHRFLSIGHDSRNIIRHHKTELKAAAHRSSRRRGKVRNKK